MRWLLLLFTLMTAGQAVAGHDWGGMDLCTLYPEKMPPGMPIEQLPQSDHPGALLMQRYCAQCHNLPGPGRHTTVEWPQVLERMDTLMEVSSRFGALLGRVEMPTQGESLQIQVYLSTNALQPMRHFSGGFREKSYQQHCSGCHALPDPAQHSADEWPMVMARMARNREVMKRAPLSPETQLTILAYLQQASLSSPSAEAISGAADSTEPEATHRLQLPRSGTWLALGPFLLLVVVGLWRWRYGQRQDGRAEPQPERRGV